MAREYLIALPAELSPQARINLVAGFSRELVERYRFALDIAIHAPRDYPGSDPRNFHAHLLATTREATREGLGAKTTLEWSDTHRRQAGLGPAVGELLHVRERWAMSANAAFEKEHIDARIDHRTLKAQGIDREPKPHIPHAALEMERHGYHSVVAERIRVEYQARVEARQRAAQHEKSVGAPRSLAEMAKGAVQRWLGYRQAPKEAQSKSQEELATEAVPRPLRYPQAQKEAQSRNPQTVANESATRWKDLYGPEAQSKTGRDLAMESAMRWKQRYGAQSETAQDVAKEAALRWKELYGQDAPPKSPEDTAKEDVQNWLRYRQEQKEAEAPKPAGARQTREREQSELAPTAGGRTRERDFDLSL